MGNLYVLPRNEIPSVDVHTNCPCYQRNKEQTVKVVGFDAGNERFVDLRTHYIVAVTKGAIRMSALNSERSVEINSQKIAFLPVGTRLRYEAVEKGMMIMFALDKSVGNVPECHTFRFQRSGTALAKKDVEGIQTLNTNDRIRSFVELAMATEHDGLKCSSYARLLVGQLLYLIQVYYSQEEYTRFYASLMSSDVVFSDFVHNNWKQYPAVNDLSRAFNMTTQQFSTHFRKVFGETPGEWIKKRRAELIYHDICTSHLSLKEIAAAHNFDMSNFIRYCRSNYGHTPGAIREQLKTA